MAKRIIIVIIALAILFGLVFGFHIFRQIMVKKYISQMINQPVTISTVKAQQQAWQPALPAVGNLTAVNGVDVNSQLPGQIVKINFQSGQDVKKGELLIQLDDSLDQQTLKSQQAQFDLNEKNYQRNLTLSQSKVISQSTLDTSRTQLLQSKAMLETAKLTIEEKKIKTPFSGRLGISQVSIGQFVSPGQPLVPLQQMDPLYVDFSLPEQDIKQLSVGQKVELSIEAFPNQSFSGSITALNAKADPTTHTISVRATVPNSKYQLFPGVFARIKIMLPFQEKVVTVPQTCVTFSLYGDSVFVITSKGKDAQGKPIHIAEQRFVTVGERHGNVVVVLSGLQPGEEVVSSGQLKLQPGLPVNINNTIKLD